jgi:hypothetical protein
MPSVAATAAQKALSLTMSTVLESTVDGSGKTA